jgi:putative transposase
MHDAGSALATTRISMSRPPRVSGFSYTGIYRYFLTFCTYRRHVAFRERHAVELVMMQFRRSAAECSCALLTYCFMPDHVHLLVEGVSDDANLRVFVKRGKQRSGRAYAKRFERPLWQEGYFDRVLRPGDDARAVARYIVANPVRAGLVHRPEDYPYSGSDVWAMRELCDGLWT